MFNDRWLEITSPARRHGSPLQDLPRAREVATGEKYSKKT
jgi:hypothetical protein